MKAVLEARSGLSPAQIDTLCAFGQALIEKNKVMNLTAITEPQAVAELHFLDCISLLQAEDFSGRRVIDVGCGAGFPGVPEETVQKAVETVQKLQPFEEICVTRAGCTVSSHCGPGTLGVLYIRKADK